VCKNSVSYYVRFFFCCFLALILLSLIGIWRELKLQRADKLELRAAQRSAAQWEAYARSRINRKELADDASSRKNIVDESQKRGQR